MRLYGFHFEVSDLEAAGKFYSQLLGTQGKPELPEHWLFNLDDWHILLRQPRKEGVRPQVQTGLALAVDDFNAVVERGKVLEREYGGIGEFRCGVVGQACFAVTDPDGNIIRFYMKGV